MTHTHTRTVHTSAFGRLGGSQGNAAQAEQFEEGGGVLVELTQLSLRPRQVDTAETRGGEISVLRGSREELNGSQMSVKAA